MSNISEEERAVKLLDRQTVLPASLPDDDPVRILHDLLSKGYADNVHDECIDERTHSELEGERDDLASRVDELEEFRDEVCEAVGLKSHATEREILAAVESLVSE